MVEFILTDILMICLAIMLMLIARALPRVQEETISKTSAFDRLMASGIPEKVDAALNGFLLKTFRKIKVSVSKADNYLTARLKKFAKETNGNGNVNSKIDFNKIAEEEKSEKL